MTNETQVQNDNQSVIVNPGRGWAISSLITGILGLGPIAILLGIIAWKSGNKGIMKVVGIIFGVLVTIGYIARVAMSYTVYY